MANRGSGLVSVPVSGWCEGLTCNLCEARRQALPGQSFEDLQEVLRAQGWLCRDGVDVCPPCRAKVQRRGDE